jgi:hypothetical protein
MANYEDDVRDANYFRTLPELSRGGGGNESGSINAQSLIDRIKGVILTDEEKREAECH